PKIALCAHSHRLSPGIKTKHPNKIAQAKRTTARIWFFWRMASAVTGGAAPCFLPRVPLLFFAEEADAVFRGAGFLFFAAVFAAVFFAGNASSSVLLSQSSPLVFQKQWIPCRRVLPHLPVCSGGFSRHLQGFTLSFSFPHWLGA